MKCFLIFIVCTVALLIMQGIGSGQLLISEEKPFSITSLIIDVSIRDQVAQVRIDQTFQNESPEDIEAVYLFPLPEGARIANFSIIVDGEQLQGDLLDKNEARALYESLVKEHNDPGLLEYVDKGLFRVRLFPVRAHSEKRITLQYEEIVHYDTGLYTWRYPLSTGRFSTRPIGTFRMNIEVESSMPLGIAYSPTHEIEVSREGEGSITHVSYAGEQIVPGEDFLLIFDLSSEELGIHILTHRKKGEDGFYLVMINPSFDISDEQIIPKDIVFVLDTSLSMKGPKMDQAKAALWYCLSNLGAQDRFNVVLFDSDIQVYTYHKGLHKNLISATEDTITEAKEYIAQLQASGSTNVYGALASALSLFEDNTRSPMMLFLTDGQPKVGIRDREEICRYVHNNNLMAARFFVFGVGYDVNTILLDQLAHENKGISSYVQPEQNIEEIVSRLYNKIARPRLTDISLEYEGIEVYDQYPQNLSDLYHGTQLITLGRYRTDDDTEARITLAGIVGEREKSWTFRASFPCDAPENEFCPRLWAARKIGFLLNRLKIGGEDEHESDVLIEEIVYLSKHYGIVTSLTYYLITGDIPDAWTRIEPDREDLASLANWWMYSSMATAGGGYTVTMAAGPEDNESGPQFSVKATYDQFRKQTGYEVIYGYVTGPKPLNPSSYNWTLPFFTRQVQPYAFGYTNPKMGEHPDSALYDSSLWALPYFKEAVQPYVFGSLLPQTAYPSVSLGIVPNQWKLQSDYDEPPSADLYASISAESGSEAVAASIVISDLHLASSVSNLDNYSIESIAYTDERGSARIKVVKDKLFILKDAMWIDSDYEGEPVTIQLKYGGERYDAYLGEISDEILHYVSVGNNFIVCLPDGGILKVIDDPFINEFGYNDMVFPYYNYFYYTTIMQKLSRLRKSMLW